MSTPSIEPAEAHSQSLPAVPFDYSSLDQEVADRQRSRADRISSLKTRTIEMMGEIGSVLLEAQADLNHGTFLDWIDQATGLSRSSAYRFMDVAKRLGNVLPIVGSLPAGLVQKLAEKSTPDEMRDSIVQRLQAGEVLQEIEVRSELREAKAANRAKRAAEREEKRRAKMSPEQQTQEDLLRARNKKGKEARERARIEEQQAEAEKRRREREMTASGAAFLVEKIGADAFAAFYSQYGGDSWKLISEAADLANAHRAKDSPVVDLTVSVFTRQGTSNPMRWLSPSEQDAITEIAKRIEAGEAVDPIYATDQGGGWYKVVGGAATFCAYVDVLHQKTIQVRVAPPLGHAQDETVEAVVQEAKQVTLDPMRRVSRREERAFGKVGTTNHA
jgi:hypothetical protein